MPKIVIDDMPAAEIETTAYFLRRLDAAEVRRLADKHGVLHTVLKSALDRLQSALVEAVLRPSRHPGKEG
jgi:hypothetical protein